MDWLDAVVTLISTLGFPIVAWLIQSNRNAERDRIAFERDKLYVELEKQRLKAYSDETQVVQANTATLNAQTGVIQSQFQFSNDILTKHTDAELRLAESMDGLSEKNYLQTEALKAMDQSVQTFTVRFGEARTQLIQKLGDFQQEISTFSDLLRQSLDQSQTDRTTVITSVEGIYTHIGTLTGFMKEIREMMQQPTEVDDYYAKS